MAAKGDERGQRTAIAKRDGPWPSYFAEDKVPGLMAVELEVCEGVEVVEVDVVETMVVCEVRELSVESKR